MKIYGIINNSAADAGHQLPLTYMVSDPGTDNVQEHRLVWTMLPDSCIIRSPNSLYLPDLSHDYELLPTLALKCCRLGKSVAPRFADRYVNEATVCVVLRDVTLHRALAGAGLPWVMAMGFDRSLTTGSFIAVDNLDSLDGAAISLTDGREELTVRLSDMTVGLRGIMAQVSRDNTVKHGDLILCSLPQRGLRATPGADFSAALDSTTLLELRIK